MLNSGDHMELTIVSVRMDGRWVIVARIGSARDIRQLGVGRIYSVSSRIDNSF